MAPTKPGKTDEPETNFELLVQMIENLSKQMVDSNTRYEDRFRLLERRFADREATNQHDEESVNGEERNHDRQRHNRRNDRDAERHNFHRGYEQDPDDRVMRSVKVDAPNFDGELNPKALLDWLTTMDRYFEWHDMSEARRVRFAKIKLVGQAGLFWTNVETQLERVGEEPIIHWGEMKERLKQKYLPLSYQQSLLDEWQTLRQDNMPVAEYIAKFEEFMLRCDIREDRRMTLSRFRSGLRPELQRELIPHTVNTLERAFQIVQELEKYLKSSNVVKQTDSQISDFHVGSSMTPSSMTPMSTTNLVKTTKGKGVLVDTRGGGTQRCYKCQGFGHFAVQCPTKEATRNLCAHINEQADNQGEFEEDIYEPQQPDEDCGIDFEVPHPTLAVVRCTLAQPRKETEDLAPYKKPDASENTSAENSDSFSISDFSSLTSLLPRPRPKEKDIVEDILDDQIVSTRKGGYKKFLVKWKNRPTSDSTWITKEDLQRIDPDILERYYSFISPESSSLQPGEIDEDIFDSNSPESSSSQPGRIDEDIFDFNSPESSSSQTGRIDEDIFVKTIRVYKQKRWKKELLI